MGLIMQSHVHATMVTTTSYGTWLPGDARWYVHRGQILPPNPRLHAHAKTLLVQEPVYFTASQQVTLFHAICDAVEEFCYQLTDIAIESWHLHWIVGHGDDSVDTMVGRLKNRMRQALAQGRIWTKGYCHRCLRTLDDLDTAREYIARHEGRRMLGGMIVRRPDDL
jgi:hypothetical protein